jgi:alkylhydroperoxidase family enzyme
MDAGSALALTPLSFGRQVPAMSGSLPCLPGATRPYFTEAERAALALGEVVTRLSDRMDPVPDEVWEEAARHFHEAELAILLLAIAGTNFFNRLHTATKQWPTL